MSDTEGGGGVKEGKPKQMEKRGSSDKQEAMC